MSMFSLIRSISPRARKLVRLLEAARAAQAARHWSDAAASYAEALALAPWREGVWVQYGHALKEQGFLREAEAAYLRAVHLDASVADTHLQIGHVMKLQGDVARAIAAYEAARRRDPSMLHGRAELAALRAGAPNRHVDADAHMRLWAGAPANTGCSSVNPALAAILHGHDLGTAVLSRFDAFFYRQAHPSVRAAVPAPGRAACLAHFCAAGLAAGLAINGEDDFDPKFYCEVSLGGMAFTPANAYRHWLTVGLATEAAPNRRRWIQAALGRGVTGLDSVDLALFAAQSDPRAGRARWIDLAERFLAEAADPARTIAPDAGNASVFAALADRLEAQCTQEGDDRALRLRQMIAWHVPDHAANRLALAAALRRQGALAPAAELYRKAVNRPDAPAAAFRALAACQEGLGLPDLALATLRAGRAVHPGDEALRRDVLDQARRFFGHEWELSFAAARLGRVADGQERLRHAGIAIRDALEAPLAVSHQVAGRAVRRVAIVGHRPLPQCRIYRIDQAIEQLETAGFAAAFFDLGTDHAAFAAALQGLDAVIFFKVPALPDIIAAIETASALGLTTFYDIDDLIFDQAYPDSLESYGGLITQEDHIGLALAVPLFDQAMRLCDFGIASTPTLAAAMRGRVRSGEVFVHPNALGSRHIAFLRANRPAAAGLTEAGRKTVTLFYGSGTKAHKAEFRTLLVPALAELVRRHGRRIAIVLMGEFPPDETLRAIAANVTVLPAVWDLEAYWNVLAGADINLAVLYPSAVTDAKSEIKWLEAAMLGIPSVVSDTATHRSVVRPGETGLICGTLGEWIAALDRLVRDPALRRRMGEAARRQALSDYGTAAMAARMEALLSAISPARQDPPAEELPLIVVVNVFYPPQAIGGATRVVHDNIGDLAASGQFRLEVFTSIDGAEPYAVTSSAQDGVRVTGVGTPNDPALEYRPLDGRMGEIFGTFLDRTRPALVHFHCIQRLTAAVAAAAASRSIPYVITVHDGWWISEHQFLLDADGQIRTYDFAEPTATLRDQGVAAYQRLSALGPALWGARRVLTVSEPFATLYRSCGVPNVTVIANGVSDLPSKRRRPAPLAPASSASVRLGFIGGLARHKGYDLVRIALCARPYSHLSLLAIDHAMAPGDVRREQWGSVPVEFRPKWPQRDVAILYRQIDVLLAPSLWPESFGLVTREALISGCWVIASNRGSIGDCVEEGSNGFKIDVSSPDDLVTALSRIDETPQRYREPPLPPPDFRRATHQARDIAACYGDILGERVGGGTSATQRAIS